MQYFASKRWRVFFCPILMQGQKSEVKNIMTTILKLPEVVKLTGLSKSSIYAYIGKGDFPRPIKLGERSSGWVGSEIESWIEKRIEHSRGDAL